MPNRNIPRAPRPVIRRNLEFFADLLGTVSPFGDTAARKAEANAASALATYERVGEIDEILQAHEKLQDSVETNR